MEAEEDQVLATSPERQTTIVPIATEELLKDQAKDERCM